MKRPESEFIKKLSTISDVYIIGGYPRNIQYCLSIKDIDCIVDNIRDMEQFNRMLDDCFLNNLGGYCYSGEDIKIDFWKTEDSYINKDVRKVKHPLDILKYVFLNMDAILYDYNRDQLFKSDDYLEFEKSGVIKTVYPENDFPANQIKKLLRYSEYFLVEPSVWKILQEQSIN